jgi:hypothetical protein
MRAAKAQSDSIHFQERDFTLLRGLFESRVMTAGHIATLFFDGKKEAAKKRLQKLKAAGLVGERRRKAYEPAVLFLSRKAFVLLREKGVLAEYPSFDLPALERRARVSPITISHELNVMDVKAAFHAAITKTREFTIEEFSTWPALYEFEAFRNGRSGEEVTVRPDGFVRIHEKEKDGGLSEHTFFLEVDRSSETQETLVNRAGCYFDYYKSGSFALRNGAARSAFKEFPFRVLMVFKTAERRNNTAERLLQNNPPILTQVCLSTIEEVTRDPLGAIWFCPVDYRKAVERTPFDLTGRREQFGYQRQTAREIFVEKKINKMKILTEGGEA